MPETPDNPELGSGRDPSKDIPPGTFRGPRPGRLSGVVTTAAVASAGALASLAVAPGRWLQATAVLAGAHAVLGGLCLAPRNRLLGPNLTRLGPEAGKGAVALTFDDGPDPEVTPAVLDLLQEAGASASFFLIGRRAEACPQLVREILRRGHRVENHTLHHPYSFAAYGPWRTAREIDGAQRILSDLAGRPPLYFRPPAGIRSPLLEPFLARRGLHLVTWTRRGFDTVEKDPKKVAARLTRRLTDGDILLLHDGNSARTRPPSPVRPVVLEALPRVLEALDRKGLRSVPLPDHG